MPELNLLDEPPASPPAASPRGLYPYVVSDPLNLDQLREAARGDLARGLLWLLTFAIGGVLAFVGLGRLDGTVITQSIFPSLIALTGTALGFYFGNSQGTKNPNSQTPLDSKAGGAGVAENRQPPVANAGPDRTVTVGATVTLKGISSAGANGAQVVYAWTLTTIPAGSKATLIGDSTSSPTFVADQPGTYVAQVIVNDGVASAPSTMNVTAS